LVLEDMQLCVFQQKSYQGNLWNGK